MSKIMQELEARQMADKKIPAFVPGDTVAVHVKVQEGERERLQAFEGMVIARRNRGYNSSFTVRKVSYGEGVERVFPVNSPNIEKIEIERESEPMRARMYYLRQRTGKAAMAVNVKEKRLEEEAPAAPAQTPAETPAAAPG